MSNANVLVRRAPAIDRKRMSWGRCPEPNGVRVTLLLDGKDATYFTVKDDEDKDTGKTLSEERIQSHAHKPDWWDIKVAKKLNHVFEIKFPGTWIIHYINCFQMELHNDKPYLVLDEVRFIPQDVMDALCDAFEILLPGYHMETGRQTILMRFQYPIKFLSACQRKDALVVMYDGSDM